MHMLIVLELSAVSLAAGEHGVTSSKPDNEPLACMQEGANGEFGRGARALMNSSSCSR
jgi:hypothetical protein